MRTGSQVNATFKGDHGAEFTWFSLDCTSLAAVGQQAAEKIVAACRRGQSSLIIGLPARLAIIGNAVLPSLTGEVMKLVNWVLPGPVGVAGDELKSGRQAQTEQRVPGWLARWSDAAIAGKNGT